VPVQSIDLSRQFGPTRCQGQDGICYSFSAVGAVEAALFRTDGVTRSFDERLAAVLASLDRGEIKARFAAVQRSQDANPKIFDGGHPGVVVNAIRKSKIVPPRGFETNTAIWETIQKTAGDISQVKTKDGTVYTAEMYSNDVKLYLKHVPWPLAPQADQEKLGNLSLEQPFDRRLFGEYRNEGFQISEACEWKGKGAERWQKFADQLTQSLCDGIPVMTSFHAHRLWTQNPPSKPIRLEDVGQHAAHANILTGLRQVDLGSGKGPQWVFEMRESWGAGSPQNPVGSRSYLPLDELCRVFDASTVVGPWDRKALKTNSADLARQCRVSGATIECSDIEFAQEPVASSRSGSPTPTPTNTSTGH
jgi:hypothetical protein